MATIEVKLFDEELTDEENETYYRNFAILADGQRIGTAAVTSNGEIGDDDHAYCDLIVINADQRNKGFGTDAIKSLSALYCGIEVAPDNDAACRLWSRLGEESDWDEACYVDQGYGVYRI